MVNNQVAVEVECFSCEGTGIYERYVEPDGVGFVCIKCNGTGMRRVEYAPFTGRRKRRGIRTVRCSIPVGVDPTGSEVTYKEFLAGKMPS